MIFNIDVNFDSNNKLLEEQAAENVSNSVWIQLPESETEWIFKNASK